MSDDREEAASVQVGRATFLLPGEASPKSEGMISPVALWRRQRFHLSNAPAPGSLREKAFFQACLECVGIGFLGFRRGWVQEYGGKSPRLAIDGSGRPRIVT